MLADSELKLNRFYWCEVIDRSHQCFGKEYRVKFTGLVFRNAEYETEHVHDYLNDDREAARKKLKERNKNTKADAIFYLSQIRIYREAPADLFNNNFRD